MPMGDILGRIGIEFSSENVVYEFSLGNPDLNYKEDTKRLFVEGVRGLDEFGKALGYKKGDELNKLNGKELRIENVKDAIGEYYATVKEGDVVSLEIYRPKMRKGKYKVKTLSASARKIKMTRKDQIALMNDVSEKQKNTLKSWVGL